MIFKHFCAAAVTTVFLAVSVQAQTSISLGGVAVDTSAALEVAADSLAVDQATGRAVFSGDVLVQQGELRLTAGRVEVVYAEATGQIA